MNKLKYIILILASGLIFACDNLDIQPEQADSFIKLYGSYNVDKGVDVKVFDSGYLILATTVSLVDNTTDINLIKTDKFGNLISEREDITKGGGDDKASRLLLTSDGGVLVLGTFDDTLNSNTDIFLRKYDASLNEEWIKYYNTPSNANEEGTVIKKAASGYIIAGSTTETGSGTKDIYLVKIEDNGDVEWTENHGYAGDDFAGDLLVLSDGYLIIGTTYDVEYANNIVAIKTNFRGISPDIKRYIGSNNVYGHSGMITEDGGYLIVGTADDISGNNSNVYVIKVQDNIHELDWSQTYGGSGFNQGFDVIKSNGGYAIVGSNEVSSGIAGYFLKIASNGEFLTENTYGGYNEQIIRSIEKTSDGGYIMVGSSGVVGNEMICLIKVNSEGEL